MNNHPGFQKRLRASGSAMVAVAAHLHAKGCSVEIRPIKVAATAGEAEHFLDDGDLIVRRRYEVKHRPDIDFTSALDWPHTDMIVSRVGVVDRAGDDVAAYVIVNASMTYCAIIPYRTKPWWRKGNILASNTGNVEDNYFCPLNQVIFEKMLP
jgi:hypothetical protein